MHDEVTGPVDYPPVSIYVPDGGAVCFWGGTPSAVTESGDIQSQLVKSGHNTGNIFFGSGLYGSLFGVTKEYINTSMIPPEALHEKYRYLFIPASNFVNRFHDMSYLHDYLVKSRIQIFCFGLGSQFLPGEEIVLHPGTEKLLKLLSDRSVSIGVRGTFTAELLWRIGIRNIDVVGCPSFLRFREEKIAQLANSKPTLARVATNYSNNVRRHSISPDALTDVENKLFRFFLDHESSYILQNEQSECDLIAANSGEDKARRAALIANISHIFDVRDRQADVAIYMDRCMRIFFDPDEWIAFMGLHSAAIGTRFHGNVAALLAGVPALFITHDMRTTELCEFFKIPFIPAQLGMQVDELIERLLQLDYGNFVSHYKNVRFAWKSFILRNGLDTNI